MEKRNSSAELIKFIKIFLLYGFCHYNLTHKSVIFFVSDSIILGILTKGTYNLLCFTNTLQVRFIHPYKAKYTSFFKLQNLQLSKITFWCFKRDYCIILVCITWKSGIFIDHYWQQSQLHIFINPGREISDICVTGDFTWGLRGRNFGNFGCKKSFVIMWLSKRRKFRKLIFVGTSLKNNFQKHFETFRRNIDKNL